MEIVIWLSTCIEVPEHGFYCDGGSKLVVQSRMMMSVYFNKPNYKLSVYKCLEDQDNSKMRWDTMNIYFKESIIA